MRMPLLALAAALATAPLVAAPGAAPAAAQPAPVCAMRDDLVLALDRAHGELLVSRGLSIDGVVIELLVSPATATWTLIETYPAGHACIVTSGDDWADVLIARLPGRPS